MSDDIFNKLKLQNAANRVKLKPGKDLTNNLFNLVAGLKRKGYTKDAEELEQAVFQYKTAEVHLYNVFDRTGEDFLEAAYPDGSYDVDPNSEYGKFYDPLEQARIMREIVSKQPTLKDRPHGDGKKKKSTAATITALTQKIRDRGKELEPFANPYPNAKKTWSFFLSHPELATYIGKKAGYNRDLGEILQVLKAGYDAAEGVTFTFNSSEEAAVRKVVEYPGILNKSNKAVLDNIIFEEAEEKDIYDPLEDQGREEQTEWDADEISEILAKALNEWVTEIWTYFIGDPYFKAMAALVPSLLKWDSLKTSETEMQGMIGNAALAYKHSGIAQFSEGSQNLSTLLSETEDELWGIYKAMFAEGGSNLKEMAISINVEDFRNLPTLAEKFQDLNLRIGSLPQGSLKNQQAIKKLVQDISQGLPELNSHVSTVAESPNKQFRRLVSLVSSGIKGIEPKYFKSYGALKGLVNELGSHTEILETLVSKAEGGQ